VAVDGKTSRGARRPDGTRVHLLGVLEHGGPLLDHPEVDVKHNETTDLLDLLEPLDLTGVVVTFDALHTVRTNLDRLVRSKDAHNVAVVKKNQPLLHARLKALPRQDVPTGSTTPGTGHGRTGPAPWRPPTSRVWTCPTPGRRSRLPAAARTPAPAGPRARPSTRSPP
jgi:hypothetical protein